MTNPMNLKPYEPKPYAPEDVHRHGCGCEWCWLGVTVNGPKPPSRFQRFVKWIAA